MSPTQTHTSCVLSMPPGNPLLQATRAVRKLHMLRDCCSAACCSLCFIGRQQAGKQRGKQSGGEKLYTLHGVTTEHYSAAVFAVAAALKRFKTMLKEERGRMHVIGTCADTWLMPACAYFRNGMMMRSTNDAHERRGTLSRSRHAPKRFKASDVC